MNRIELREFHDDDRDAVSALVRSSPATALGATSQDVDAWLDRVEHGSDAALRIATLAGEVIGIAGADTVDGDRELVFAFTRGVDADVTAEVVRIMTSLEPVRPLVARLADQDDPSHAVLASVGFVESSRDGAEIVYVLPPTLE